MQKGIRADDFILYLYSLLQASLKIKIFSFDKFREYRNRYRFNQDDFIPIKKPKQMSFYLKTLMFLDEI